MKVLIVLESAPGGWPTPPVKRLALLLKTALRGFGWRCLEARELEPDPQPVAGCQCDLCKHPKTCL